MLAFIRTKLKSTTTQFTNQQNIIIRPLPGTCKASSHCAEALHPPGPCFSSSPSRDENMPSALFKAATFLRLVFSSNMASVTRMHFQVSIMGVECACVCVCVRVCVRTWSFE